MLIALIPNHTLPNDPYPTPFILHTVLLFLEINDYNNKQRHSKAIYSECLELLQRLLPDLKICNGCTSTLPELISYHPIQLRDNRIIHRCYIS